MAQRLIRDGLLESEAVLSLPVEARWLYVTILLSADDVGLFEATTFKLARKADIKRESAEQLMRLLVDADLIRLYQHDGKTYGFVPRFGQRLQIKRSRFPLPDASLLHGDSDALNKINDLASKKTVENGGKQQSTVAQPPEPEPEPEEIHSVAKATGGKPPIKPVSQDMDDKDKIFTYGVPMLVNAGSTDKAARSFLGGLTKGHGDAAVVQALRDCIKAKAIDPLTWLAKALPPKGSAQKPNKQEALEARNRAVADQWLRDQEENHASV